MLRTGQRRTRKHVSSHIQVRILPAAGFLFFFCFCWMRKCARLLYKSCVLQHICASPRTVSVQVLGRKKKRLLKERAEAAGLPTHGTSVWGRQPKVSAVFFVALGWWVRIDSYGSLPPIPAPPPNVHRRPSLQAYPKSNRGKATHRNPF